MRSQQTSFLISRARCLVTRHAVPIARPCLRTYADTHPIDKITDEQLDQPLSTTQSAVGEEPVTTPVTKTPQTEREERIAKAQIIFGSRLAGPAERKADLDRDSTYIAGVRVPPRPEEPDNCCMSGCVNCVWDRYREEYEDWAEKTAEAQAALAQQKAVKAAATNNSVDSEPTVLPAAISMDDDGGGSETNWSANEADPFADIPVGIREFMKTEKRLKARHASESASNA